MITPAFWQGKKVYLTGHTGFKGGWLSIWLASLGAVVKGYSLAPSTSPNLFDIGDVGKCVESEIGDIRDYDSLFDSMQQFSPEIVFHMAAQPLVRLSYQQPLETYAVNVMGTANVLEAVRNCNSVKSIVIITTDKCYENNEWPWGYRESDPMGGVDPYSSSKGCAELVSASYRRSFLASMNIGVATTRAGNVVGGGDWADDRLIPDILRSFDAGMPVVIRNPKATRPWQHVLEPLSGYLTLAEELYLDPLEYAGPWNFGPNDQDVKPVDWILDKMTEFWPGSRWELDESPNPHEAGSLKLDISKAKAGLGWTPTWDLEYTLQSILQWHAAWKGKSDMHLFCVNEISKFTKDMNCGND
ncbi:MAG: CDP-glucose 4,6-dehydratase [Halioglobus sp.]